jgi:hypothetical protein
MASLNYNSNPNLKAIGVQLQYTPHEVQEWMKCKNDPVYFIKQYVKIITLDYGLQPFKLFDYQVDFIQALHENRRVIGMFPRQHGKCVEKTTKYTIRNKKTGEVLNVTAEEFHKICNKNM